MKEQYYEYIFKRKSFHLFRNVGTDRVSKEELAEIEKAYADFERLYPDTKTSIRIVPAGKVNFKRDAEYCVLIYSEKNDNYLLNIGYIGEQLDLWLTAHHIGSLWYGIGKPDEPTYNGMDFVIMLAMHKVNDDTKFRKDMYKAKRKPISETWSGEVLEAANIARFAPSACNTQPWFTENRNGELTVYRYKKADIRGIMPASAVSYFNRVDVGIYLCILEICLKTSGLTYERELYTDDGGDREMTRVAVYKTAADQTN